MADWNPNEPRLLGLEWMPHYASGQPLAAAAQIGAAWFDSTGAETIVTLGAFFQNVTEEGQWLMEVYDDANAVIGADATEVFRPNLDVARVNATNQAGAIVNLYQSIDEAVLSYTDYVTSTVGASASYDHELNTSTWAANRRVKDVQITFVGRQIAGSHLWQLLVADAAEGFFTYWSQTVNTETGVFTVTVSLGESNPFTGLPWWESDIEDFDNAGAGKYLRWRFVEASDATAEARLYQVYMTVVYATENRECVASLTPSATTLGGWEQGAVVTPAGAASWSKANGTEYLVTMRRFRKSGAGTAGGTDVPPPAETGRAQWGYLGGALYLPSRASYAPTLDTYGGIESLGDAGTRGYAFGMERAAAVFSLDSQPYDGDVPYFPLTSAVTVAQLVTPSVNQSPTRCRVMVHVSSVLSGTLTVTVTDAAPPPTIVGTITAAAVEALPFVDAAQQWRLVEIELTAGLAVLVAGTQYTVTLSVNAGTWQIGLLDTDTLGDNFTNADTATYGGVTDVAILAGFAATGADLMLQLVQPPAAPANPVGVAGTSAATGDGSDCSAATIAGANLAWTATALGATFARYEIGRNEGDGIVVVLSQLTEAVVAAYDYTALRGVAAAYWLRVVDTLGVASNWVSLGTVTANAVGCELIFTTNENLALSLTGSDGPLRTWDFLSAENVTYMQMEGRDYQVALRATEDRGDRFTRDLMLWGNDEGTAPAGGSGRVVFDAILALAAADLAYIAVLDSDGRRWLAAIRVPRGSRRMPGQHHTAEVEVTEITAEPLVEITGAQVAPVP